MKKTRIKNRFQSLSESLPTTNGERVCIVIPYGVSEIDSNVVETEYFRTKFLDTRLMEVLPSDKKEEPKPKAEGGKKPSNN